MFELLFYLVPTLMIAGVGYMAFRLVHRARRISRTWQHGLTAEARCLRMYTTTSGGGGDTSVSTSVHHVYEYTTGEGVQVRFEEAGGPATVLEGDFVTVRYLPEQPRLATESGCVLAFLGLIVVFCLGFMAVAHAMFSAADGLMP
ncbi:DUF3592 domain-containing protein [Streptomyces sp. IBSBF 3136]|uniref:DUF3592 domain-containing protein n=1 Tax=Streptomyces sp. IBSBF 3136 TaxID=2903524 RepID=UPI002FDC5D2F